MDNETVEEYTTKDMGKDIVKDVAKIAVANVAAVGGLLAIGFTYSMVRDFRERRAAKKELSAEI